jgi:hypothetical protein
MAATFVGQRILEALHVDLMAAALLGQRLPNALCDSLIGQSFRTRRGSSRETLLHSKRCSLRAFLLVSQPCECSLMVVAPQSLTGNPDVETAAAKPQEDGLGSSRLACVSGALATCSLLLACVSSCLLAGTSGLLVEELLAAGSLVLASASSLLLESASSSLLAGASGLFLDEAMVFVRPHVVDGPLPILVRALRESAPPMKNGPPVWPRRQQSGSLVVFAEGSLKPIFVTRWSTRGVRRVVVEVDDEQPRGARGGGWDHLCGSHHEGSEREDKDKWAGGDPPFPICGGGGRGFFILVRVPL